MLGPPLRERCRFSDGCPNTKALLIRHPLSRIHYFAFRYRSKLSPAAHAHTPRLFSRSARPRVDCNSVMRAPDRTSQRAAERLTRSAQDAERHHANQGTIAKPVTPNRFARGLMILGRLRRPREGLIAGRPARPALKKPPRPTSRATASPTVTRACVHRKSFALCARSIDADHHVRGLDDGVGILANSEL
jgi:hypothetical protein